jgi:hypothetical protein
MRRVLVGSINFNHKFGRDSELRHHTQSFSGIAAASAAMSSMPRTPRDDRIQTASAGSDGKGAVISSVSSVAVLADRAAPARVCSSAHDDRMVSPPRTLVGPERADV